MKFEKYTKQLKNVLRGLDIPEDKIKEVEQKDLHHEEFEDAAGNTAYVLDVTYFDTDNSWYVYSYTNENAVW